MPRDFWFVRDHAMDLYLILDLPHRFPQLTGTAFISSMEYTYYAPINQAMPALGMRLYETLKSMANRNAMQ